MNGLVGRSVILEVEMVLRCLPDRRTAPRDRWSSFEAGTSGAGLGRYSRVWVREARGDAST